MIPVVDTVGTTRTAQRGGTEAGKGVAFPLHLSSWDESHPMHPPCPSQRVMLLHLSPFTPPFTPTPDRVRPCFETEVLC